MASYVLTPEVHHVFNEFDKQGLLLGLKRLTEERNDSYKQRLFDVFANRADSSYFGLINGITRELGLQIKNCMRINPKTDDNGDFLTTFPAVVFQDTKCYLYSDYQTGTLIDTLDRWDIDGGCWDLTGLADRINTTSYFEATILDDVDNGDRSMTIFNQSSVELVPFEDISGRGLRIILDNNNLVPDTVAITSPNLFRKVTEQTSLTDSGDYLIDLEKGILYTVSLPAPGSYIRYQYRKSDFVVKSSPVILNNLQSTDFQTKMFEQVLGDDGEYSNGRPTALGADLINELLSVYPTNFGK